MSTKTTKTRGIGVSRKKRKGVWSNKIDTLQLSILAIPAVLLLVIFNYIPFFGFILPFKDYRAIDGIFGSKWIGLKNFEFLFSGEDVLRATRNTVLYNIVFIISGVLLSMAFAIMLYHLTRRAVKTYQTIFFLPYFVSWVVASYAFSAFLDMEHGIFNHVLSWLGMETVMWYNKPAVWPFILFFANIWKTLGYNAIIYYTEIMSIDKGLFEAARIDGATSWQETKYITIPCLRRILVLLLITNIGKIFSGDFGMFYNLTLDSSLLYETTDIIDTYVYRALMNLGNIGMSSAATFYQTVVGFILVIVSNTIIKKIDSENAVF